MRKIIALLFFALLLTNPNALLAQSHDENDDESRYLVGAVPQVEGKVVFQKEFTIPGMSQEQIYQRMLKWLEKRLAENNNQSRVVYTQPEEGVIAGIGEQWIVFKSSALSLDRTWMNYTIQINCRPQHCSIEIEKIRYTYQEKEKYNAEEWIADKVALNKSQTKLIRGLAKWRKKTVDFADAIFDGAAQALGAADVQPQPATQAAAAVATGPVVIQQAKPVEVATPAPVVVAPSQPAAATTSAQLKEVEPALVPKDAIRIGEGKIVIAIGTDAFNMTMMTANAGGSIGKIEGKPVVFTILSPDQPYEAIEKAENYTVKFFPTGQNEPSVVLECVKMPSQNLYEGQPRTYIGQITKAWIKE